MDLTQSCSKYTVQYLNTPVGFPPSPPVLELFMLIGMREQLLLKLELLIFSRILNLINTISIPCFLCSQEPDPVERSCSSSAPLGETSNY